MILALPLTRSGCLLAAVGLLAGNIFAQTRQQQELLRHARETSSILEGTWVLQQRITPTGKLHRQPLSGEFTVKLGVDEGAAKYALANSATPLAMGSYSGKERGVLDLLMSQDALMGGGPAIKADGTESGGDVLFEMSGSSGLELLIDPQTPAVSTLVFRDLELKGTYGVFRQGVRSQRLPTTFRKSDTGFLFSRKPTLELVTAVLSASDVEIPAGAVGFGSPGDKSHDIVRQVVRGDRMEITYGNGGRDIWVKKQTSEAAEN